MSLNLFTRFLIEGIDKPRWAAGGKNRKWFTLYGDFHDGSHKKNIIGCKTCDEITPLKQVTTNSGAYEASSGIKIELYTCTKCGSDILYDPDRISDLDYYFTYKSKIDVDHERRIRRGLAIHITYTPLKIDQEPDVVDCKPFDVKSTYGGADITVDKLYVYTIEFKSDSLSHSPINNIAMRSDIDRRNLVILDMDSKSVYTPYPETEIDNKFPPEVAKVFKQYVKKYV